MTVICEQCHRTLVWNMHWSSTAATRRPTLSRTTARSATAPLTRSKRSRHRDVSRLLCQYGLSFESFPFDDPHGCLKEYGTSVGIFICTNSSCSSLRWTSKQIAISIRRYPGLRYNARVCYQRCESCDSLTIPELDDSYAQRVSNRLAKWSGIAAEEPPSSGGSRRPHQARLCKGCKHGHCQQSRL